MSDDFVFGTVTQASPLLVVLDGAKLATPSLRLSPYTPALNDRVIIGMIGSRLLTFGKVL